jgi:hypothetical protein
LGHTYLDRTLSKAFVAPSVRASPRFLNALKINLDVISFCKEAGIKLQVEQGKQKQSKSGIQIQKYWVRM